MTESTAIPIHEAPAEERSEHDFSKKKQPRVIVGECDPPPKGALTWEQADVYGGQMGRLFREWRAACFWRWRRDLIVRSLTVVLPEYAISKGFAYPGNKLLAEQCWTSKEAIDHALTRMIAKASLIRVHAIVSGRDKTERRLYLAKGIVDEFGRFNERRKLTISPS
jgi:hypothetical protein